MTTSNTETGQHESAIEVSGFASFFAEVEPRLRAALVAKHGPDTGRDAAAEALAYGWQAWHRVAPMTNPAGYLYRVGDRWATHQHRKRRKSPLLNSTDGSSLAGSSVTDVELDREPRLGAAIDRLTPRQRQVVVLAVAFGLTHREAAELLGLSRSSVQNHAERGMRKLRRELGVNT